MSKAQCLDCEGYMESKHRHDFVRCECGSSFLDGGDEYIRAGGNIVILDGEQKLYPLQQDPELSELLKDVIIDDMFGDKGYLDDDFDDYNLGVQAGTLDERDRVIKLLEDYDFSAVWRQVEWNPDSYEGFGPDELISLIKKELNGTN